MCVSHSLLGHILTSQRLVFDVSWAQLEEAVRDGDVVSDSLQFDLQPLPRRHWFLDDDDFAAGPVVTEDSLFRQGNRGSVPWCGFPATLLVFCRCSYHGMHATACIANMQREVVVVLDGITFTLRSNQGEWEAWYADHYDDDDSSEICHGCPDCAPSMFII